MSVDMSAAAIDARLREVSLRAAPLRAELRLSTKIDLSATGIASRLREASELLEVCVALSQASKGAKRA